VSIKIITLYQPWASLAALRLKQYETRSFYTKYRGLLAIHAGKRPMDKDADRAWLRILEAGDAEIQRRYPHSFPFAHQLPLGAIVAVCELTDCQIMKRQRGPVVLPTEAFCSIEEQTPLELTTGDWQPGRYAWKLENVLALPTPIACRGYQGMRELPAELELAINQQINPGRFA
jgi:activating signal cointegrator 1